MAEEVAISDDLKAPAIVERAKSMALDWMWAIQLQHSRLTAPRSEDEPFHPFGAGAAFHEADLHFLVIALGRLRTSAITIQHAPEYWPAVRSAIRRFDARIPWRKQMRDVFEHLEDYAVDSSRRRTNASRRGLQTWQATGHRIRIPLQAAAGAATGLEVWEDALEVDWDEALQASKDLYTAVRKTYDSLPRSGFRNDDDASGGTSG